MIEIEYNFNKLQAEQFRAHEFKKSPTFSFYHVKRPGIGAKQRNTK